MSSLPATPLPVGYRAVRVLPGDREAAVRLCVLVRQAPDPAAGALVALGEQPDALRYLGVAVDAGGRVREWLEWWVQHPGEPELSATPARHAETVLNPALDERWTRRAASWRRTAPDLSLETGWESAHPLPVWIDVEKGQPVTPADGESGPAWELCRDDAALAAAGLPTFSASAHRYLWNRASPPRFLPAANGAPPPPGELSVPLAQRFAPLAPFNPAGGLLMVRHFLPLDCGQFADVLSGAPWPGLPHGKETLRLHGPANAAADGWLLPRAGRLAERFHLKICLVLEALRAVRAATQETGGPMLDLSAASFRVRLPEGSPAGMPFLWNAQPVLHASAGAMPAPVTGPADAPRWLLPAGGPGVATPYRPDEFLRWKTGSATVRLGKFNRLDDGAGVLEGTLAALENLPGATTDLLRLRLRLGPGGEPTDFDARPDPPAAAAPGETRFRTLPRLVPEPAAQALAAAEGTVLPGVTFETLPDFGSPCDLHTLGILALRCLLACGVNSLEAVADELRSLARQAGPPPGDKPASLERRLEKAAAADPRWLRALGPQNLTREEELTAKQAFEQVPPALWWQTLALAWRSLPGADAESFSASFGGVSADLFDEPIRLWEDLVRRSRSLVVVDWRQNREIRSIIDQCRLL